MLQSKREIHEMSQFSQTEHKICWLHVPPQTSL
jgi:hypothetical protein